MEPEIDIYDDLADECSEMVAKREEQGIENEPIIRRLLEVIGGTKDDSY